MVIDSTFWVAISFIIFFGGLIYLKVPHKINEILNKLILDIKNEIDESEKLRTEAKTLLENSRNWEIKKAIKEAFSIERRLIVNGIDVGTENVVYVIFDSKHSLRKK